MTVEALAYYLLEQVLAEGAVGPLIELEIFVSSGDGQASSARWRVEE